MVFVVAVAAPIFSLFLFEQTDFKQRERREKREERRERERAT